MNSRQKDRRAKIAVYAEEYRKEYCSDSELFTPMEHIHFELSKRKDLTIAQRTDLREGGLPVPARVKFFKSGTMRLEYTESTGREAMRGFPSSRFALCHEIGHVNLHKRKMKGMIEGAVRNFTGNSVKLHSETAGMEEEAHIYGGLLLIPLSQITVDVNYMELAERYNAPPNTAKILRLDVLEVWSNIQRIKRLRNH